MPLVKTSKEEILQKTARVILRQGYRNSSFADLSKACGIRSAHFFYYFRDKEDLMTQVLELTYQYFKQKVFSVAYRDDLPPTERLELLKRKINVLNKTESGCIFGNAALENSHLDSPFLKVVRVFFTEFIAALSYIYGQKYDEAEAHDRATQSLQQLEGAVMMMKLFKDRSYLLNALARIQL